MKLRAAIDAAWTAAVLGAMMIVLRHEIEPVIRQWRADMDARSQAVKAETDRLRARRGFVEYLRERGIEPTTHDLGMES